MFKNKRKTISVSMLSRYWSDPEKFEEFLKTTPNKRALAAGQNFHQKGPLQYIPKLIIFILSIGGAYAFYFFIMSS